MEVEKGKVQPKATEPKDTEKPKPCICICDKQALRKAQMQSAMDFYRNSPDYRFVRED